MTTTLRVPVSQSSRRRRVLATASALVAAGSIAVTLAVAGGGSDANTAASPPPVSTHAHPDRGAFHQRGAQVQRPSGAIDGKRSAERFHHFR